MAFLSTSGPTAAANSRPRRPGNGWDGGVEPLFIEPGCPWDNAYNESFDGKLRDGLLDGEIFCTLQEAQLLIENGEPSTTPLYAP